MAAGLAARRPQDRLHQPHDLAALRRLPADVGARLGAHGASRDGEPRDARAGAVRAAAHRARGRVQAEGAGAGRRAMRAPCSRCVEWIAPGFEIVQSHFPDWKFAAADCTAAFGLHGALVVGTPVAVTERNRARARRRAAGVHADAAARRRGDRHRASAPTCSTVRRWRSRISRACSRGSRSSRRSPPARSSRPARSPTRGRWRRGETWTSRLRRARARAA